MTSASASASFSARPRPPSGPGASRPPRSRGARKKATRSTSDASARAPAELAASLHEHRDHVEGPQRREERAEVHAPAVTGQLEHAGPARAKGGGGAGGGRRHARQHHAPGIPRAKDPRLGRRAQPAVGHDAEGLLGRKPGVTHRELRIVRQHGPDAHDDGVRGETQPVGLQSGRFARDPPGLPVRRRDLAVERHGRLERDVRPALRHRAEERAVQGAGLGLPDADRHPHARRLEPRQAAPCDLVKGVGAGRDHARHSGPHERVRARRRAAEVRARLEGHVAGGALRGRAGGLERHGLGVGSPGPEMSAFPDHALALDQHRPDHRVRRGPTEALRGEPEGPVHPERVAPVRLERPPPPHVRLRPARRRMRRGRTPPDPRASRPSPRA